LPDSAQPTLPSVGQGVLRLEPATLTLPRAFVGHSVTVPVHLSHESVTPVVVALSVEPPFSLDERTLVLDPGTPRTVTVRLMPSAPGTLDSGLTVVSMQPELQVRTVPLRATVEAVPPCTPSSACRESHFDASSGRCEESPLPGGSCDDGPG
jgi:hypothetical protein